jgi:hypothetical protein
VNEEPKTIFGSKRTPPEEVLDPSFSVVGGRDPNDYRLAIVHYRRAIEAVETEEGEEVISWRTGPYNIWLVSAAGATVTLPPDSTMTLEDGQLVLRIPNPWDSPWDTPPEPLTP